MQCVLCDMTLGTSEIHLCSNWTESTSLLGIMHYYIMEAH